MKILLDYFFKITSIIPTQQASTAFLKQACVVALPKDGGVTTGVITECSTSAEYGALVGTDAAAEIAQLFSAGLSKVYVLPMDDLDLEDALDGVDSDFFTILISSDFDKANIAQAAAYGTVTITSYANLVSGTDDAITIEGVTLTAQTGAVVAGENTFRAATSNDATAASLAAQINAHATLGDLVEATVVGAVVTITALDLGLSGNDIDLTYTDNDTNVGATLAHLSGGKLSGGDGLFLGTFKGVTGVSETDDDFLATQAAIERRCAFHAKSTTKAQNMFYAFGALLANTLNWKNQQYITMPLADDVDTNGEADALFDDKISFVISDDEFGERLALFACGGQPITAPYIVRNLQTDMQSEALSYVSGNQPEYTPKNAALLEDELEDVILDYIADQYITDGTVEITLEEDNFVASGSINITPPTALWRISGEMRQTL